MKEFPRKFLSLRDKNGNHHRSKSVPPGHKDKARPLSTEAFRAMFKKDGSKQALKSEGDQNELDQAKIEEIRLHLEKAEVLNVTDDYVRDIMSSNIGDGDVGKTAEFIILEQKAAAGAIVPYNPNVLMLGAENRGNVTCYLDSLLFAMFSKLDAFECMLKSDFSLDDPRIKLVTLLRIWVNLLRSGNLIRTDFTKLMQDAMSDCGWADAKLLEQQDTSEAFAFLTETLQLPLLSLQVDLFHQGKKDKEDHKVVYERLLNLAVPPDPEGKEIKLEDCLEEYFNARVDVLRDHEESKNSSLYDRGSGDASPLPSQNTKAIRIIRPEDSFSSSLAASPDDITPSQQQSFGGPLHESPSQSSKFKGTEQDGALGVSLQEKNCNDLPSISNRPRLRTRSTSIIQRVVVDQAGRPRRTEDSVMAKRAERKGSTIVKAITIPAWQFFRLIPWHALTPNEPRSDTEVALSFDQRPVLGICLKRYAMTESGQPQRYNTFIDIPDSLRLPHFMLAAGPNLEEDINGLSNEYKLVLQSVVCHRGDSLQSGHYVAFARVAPKLLTGNRRHDFDPPPDYEEAQWVKFDDLKTDSRVSYVDDIKQALRSEMPYLLFYQIVPMFDMVRCSINGSETGPPSYNESKKSIETNNGDTLSSAYGRLNGNHREDLQELDTSLRSKPPSIRLSAEFDRAPRGSLWSMSHTGSTPMGSRRESMANTESPAVTPGANSPVISSPVISPVDEPSSSRLSRAASRFALGRQSRPESQSGEGRISLTMTRLGSFMKPSREALTEPSFNSLPVSASNSIGLPSDTSGLGPESPVDGERHFRLTPQGKEKDKHKHRSRAKDREKSEKHKNSQEEQPERECVLM